MQGVALGGESVGAVLMTVEAAPAARHGMLGALVMAAAPLGIIMASLVLLTISKLSEAQLLDWGWRLPFLFSLLLVAVGFYIRQRVDETPVFASAHSADDTPRFPVAEIFSRFKRPLVAVTIASMAETCFIYLFNVFVLSMAQGHWGYPAQRSLVRFSQGTALHSSRFHCSGLYRIDSVVAACSALDWPLQHISVFSSCSCVRVIRQRSLLS